VEKLKARKLLESRADSPQSGARFVRPHGWQKKQPDEKKLIGAEALNVAGKPTLQKDQPYYDTVAGKTPLPKKTVANEINLANMTINEQEKPSGRPTDYEEKTSRVKNAKEQDAVEKTVAGKP